MKLSRLLLAPVLTTPVLLAFAALGESPTFSPEEGTKLTKRIVVKTELSLDEMTMIMNGEEVPAEMMQMSMESTITVVATVTDEYVSVGDGRPTKLKRTFDELNSETEVSMSSSQMPDDVNNSSSGSSDLEGLTVVFSWDEDEGDFTAEFDEDSDGDDELLEGLTEDLDFRAMLPDGEVSEGDSWDVDPMAIRAIFAPGGNVKIASEDRAAGGGMMGGASPMNVGQFLEELEGDVTAELTGIEEEDGIRIAVIALSIDVSSSMDLTDHLSESMENQEMPEGMEIEIEVDSFDSEFLFEGEGELRWNLTAGIVYSLEVTGEVSQINDTAMNMSIGGMEQSMEQTMTFAGTQTITLTTETEG